MMVGLEYNYKTSLKWLFSEIGMTHDVLKCMEGRNRSEGETSWKMWAFFNGPYISVQTVSRLINSQMFSDLILTLLSWLFQRLLGYRSQFHLLNHHCNHLLGTHPLLFSLHDVSVRITGDDSERNGGESWWSSWMESLSLHLTAVK